MQTIIDKDVVYTGELKVEGDMYVEGNVTVNGTITSVNFETVTKYKDRIINSRWDLIKELFRCKE